MNTKTTRDREDPPVTVEREDKPIDTKDREGKTESAEKPHNYRSRWCDEQAFNL